MKLNFFTRLGQWSQPVWEDSNFGAKRTYAESHATESREEINTNTFFSLHGPQNVKIPTDVIKHSHALTTVWAHKVLIMRNFHA
jgi:hypothetical protein